MRTLPKICSWLIVVAMAIATSAALINDVNADTLRTHPKPTHIGNLDDWSRTQTHPPIIHRPGATPAPTAATAAPQLSVSPTGGCASGSSQPTPIVALSSALKCDPDLIFEYVYDNIEFEPLYGSNKGALGTLLDRRGDDADQAILLASLLNAAGYSAQTQFAWGVIRLTGAQISNWLGVANDAVAIEDLLAAGGIPQNNATQNTDGTLDYIDLIHFAVALELSGTWYVFDPSYKQHALVSGIPSLASAMGYNRAQFLADAGGTINSVSISNVNRVGLRADLESYANNLVNYVNQNNHAWSVGNVIGGKSIQNLTGSPIRLTNFPNQSPAYPVWYSDSSFPADCPGETGVECRTFISITMPSASPTTQAIKLYTDQVYGERITVFSVPAGANYVPTLLVNGAVPSCVAGGTCTNIGPATAAGGSWLIPTAVTQPNQSSVDATSCPTGVTATYCKTLTVASAGNYLISTSVGQVGRGMAEYHRQLLAGQRAANNSDSSEPVLGETLAVIGYNWLAQGSVEQRIADQLAQTTTIYNFAFGIVGQAKIQGSSLGYQAPYVDLPVNQINITPQSSSGPSTTIGGYSYPTAFVAAGFTFSESSSAFEAAVLQQTQAPVSGMTAASTVILIDDNMNPSYSGALQKTFFADGTSCTGQAAFTSTIEPAISSHYSSTDYNNIVSAVMAGSANCPGSAPTGQQVVIPQNGQLAVGLWTGAGYTEIFPQSSDISIVQKITGGLSGGESGTNVPNPAPNAQNTLNPTDTVVDKTLIDMEFELSRSAGVRADRWHNRRLHFQPRGSYDGRGQVSLCAALFANVFIIFWNLSDHHKRRRGNRQWLGARLQLQRPIGQRSIHWNRHQRFASDQRRDIDRRALRHAGSAVRHADSADNDGVVHDGALVHRPANQQLAASDAAQHARRIHRAATPGRRDKFRVQSAAGLVDPSHADRSRPIFLPDERPRGPEFWPDAAGRAAKLDLPQWHIGRLQLRREFPAHQRQQQSGPGADAFLWRQRHLGGDRRHRT